MSHRPHLRTATCAALLLAASATNAALVTNNLTGNTQYDGWDVLTAASGLTTSTLSTAPGFGSNEAGSGDAHLLRTSGAHFPASVGLYSFSIDSSFEIADSTAVAGVQTVVFSIRTWANPDFGDGTTPAGSIKSGPVLNYNGGAQALTANFTGVAADGTVNFGGPVNVYIYTYQWDLTGLAGITTFAIDWGQRVHAGVLGLQVEQSDTFSVSSAVVAPVPVPAAVWLLGSAIGMLRFRRPSQTRSA